MNCHTTGGYSCQEDKNKTVNVKMGIFKKVTPENVSDVELEEGRRDGCTKHCDEEARKEDWMRAFQSRRVCWYGHTIEGSVRHQAALFCS